MAFEKILCAVDFSEPSKKSLSMAINLANEQNASLTILHVFQIPIIVLPEGSIQPSEEAIIQLNASVDRALEEWKAEAIKRGVKRLEAVAVQGDPWRMIVERAAEAKNDLIVVGTHGHTGLKHLVVGSVAEQVVRHAGCPVLTVRA